KQGYSKHYKLKKEKILVIPNRINLKRFKFREIKKQKNVLLFVHWLSKRKGADMITQIALKLKPLIKDFKILVIGDGPYKENLLEEIEENKLKKYIDFIGFVPNKDIVEYYEKANLFILPSMEEGFPMSLLEPMAMGIPFVSFDVGAVKEISPETGQRFLVKPGDIDMFVHKIEILLNDKEIYEKFKEQGLEKIKEYEMENVVEKFIKLFK
ncbi:glycosyltransferase family 4 protein, partial [Patescibacteria group bacterium]|nr:glycosyltransferase family 4 protein [Patescibacteria group bacterium]